VAQIFHYHVRVVISLNIKTYWNSYINYISVYTIITGRSLLVLRKQTVDDEDQ